MAIASAPRTSASTSLTVVDDRGGAASVELFPGGPGRLRARPTACWCAPTTSSPTPAADGCLASTISVSTELRREHLVEAFAAAPPQTAADVLAAMTHHLPDGGVCRHPLTDTDPVLWHRTLATVAIDVTHRTPRRARERPLRPPDGARGAARLGRYFSAAIVSVPPSSPTCCFVAGRHSPTMLNTRASLPRSTSGFSERRRPSFSRFA